MNAHLEARFIIVTLFQWGVLPLADNDPAHKCYYKVSVYTGLRSNSGTRSKVYIVVSGEDADSGVRALDDGKKKVKLHAWCCDLQSCNLNIFILRHISG